MPHTARPGARIHWRRSGRAGAPPLVLLNSIGTAMTLWDAVLPHLAGLDLLRIDTRGHGGSDAPDGDYELATLANDVAAAMDDAGLPRASVAGVSLGGMIAMELALPEPSRVAALALVCTSATIDRPSWHARVERVREAGTGAMVDLAVQRFFSDRFRAAHPDTVEHVARDLAAMADTGYAGCAAAIRDMTLADRIAAIAVPTLVIAGDDDASTPFAGHGEHLVARIPGATVAHLASGHLAPLEQPAALAALLVGQATRASA